MTVSTDKNQYLADLSCVSSFYQVLMCGKNWFHVLPSESVQDNYSAGMLTRIRTICPGSLDVLEPRFGSDHKWRKVALYSHFQEYKKQRICIFYRILFCCYQDID